MKKITGVLLGTMVATIPAQAQIIINEVMQSNIDCLVDDSNEFPDSWVELYNPQGTSENLNRYKIGLSADISSAYSLPDKSIAPKGYVVIYCDKANNNLHTHFRLESGKNGSIYLFKDGKVVDKIEKMKKQPAPNIKWEASLSRLSINNKEK